MVPIVPLDELSITPDYVKIDVEGFEVEVLRGMADTIVRRLPTFMIECSPANLAQILSVLGPSGYRAYAFDQAGHGFRPYDGGALDNLFYLPPAQQQSVRLIT
jgi:hypothetical protein